MKTRRVLFTTVALAALLVIGLAGAGWLAFGRNVWGGNAQAQGPQYNTPQGFWGWGPMGMTGRFFGRNATPSSTPTPQSQPWSGWGPMGMMGRYFGGQNADGTSNMPCLGTWSAPANPAGQPLTIEQAKEAVEKYVANLDTKTLEVEEVMEFTQNFYAIVKETDTGIGAMELLVDKYAGVVGPEYGPNMMWNAKYGTHKGAACCNVGSASGEMTVKPEEALSIAQRWLDANRPGVTTESQADPFYGYYTIHTLKDGKVNGMLSVHGATGQVWYHNWHGDFVQMIGEEN